jgi:5-(carboxyamino)imidazole ribonucleotide synthase
VGDIRTAIPPGSVIGIIGGGQLAKMIAIAGAYLGYRSHIYCPDKLSPAFQVADRVTVAEYSDTNALDLFAGEVDVITYEFENVPSACVKHLAQWRPVRPSQTILEVSQHRFREKSFLNSIGVRTARFYAVNDQQGLLQALDAIGYPAVLKTCQGGYDGKGQVPCPNQTQTSPI